MVNGVYGGLDVFTRDNIKSILPDVVMIIVYCVAEERAVGEHEYGLQLKNILLIPRSVSRNHPQERGQVNAGGQGAPTNSSSVGEIAFVSRWSSSR